jgi:hypothetical protein
MLLLQVGSPSLHLCSLIDDPKTVFGTTRATTRAVVDIPAAEIRASLPLSKDI